MKLWTPHEPVIPDLEDMLKGHNPDRRKFLQYIGLAAGGILFGPDLLQKAFEGLAPKANASPASPNAVFGYVFDVYTGEPLSNILVTLNGTQYTTGQNGYYVVGSNTTDVPDLPTQPVQHRHSGGFGCNNDSPTEPDNQSSSRAKTMDVTTYLPNLVYFEDQTGSHWNASHDVTTETNNVQINATLPRFQSTRFAQNLTPAQFQYIWYTYEDPINSRLFTYRTQDLPIPVDGDMDMQPDWDLVQNSVNRLNTAVGLEMYRIAQGNGIPQQPNKTGIYIYHNAGGDVSTPMMNDDNNPAYLLGGITLIKNSDFLLSDGRVLDHEIDFRLQNYSTYYYQNGIFSLPAQHFTDFNREHLLLLRLLRVSMETQDRGHSKNDLIAYDYVRPIQ